jgi:predicted acetyltransferase
MVSSTTALTLPRLPGLMLSEASLGDGIDVWAMLREIGPGENGFGNEGFDVPYSHFQSYLQRRIDMKLGVDLHDGRVPMTTYWLFSGQKPVALCKLRHRLTDSLRRVGGHIGYCVRPTERRKGFGRAVLALALLAAGEQGIDRVLITCNEDNRPSRRVVERNGGVLDRNESGLSYYWVSRQA